MTTPCPRCSRPVDRNYPICPPYVTEKEADRFYRETTMRDHDVEVLRMWTFRLGPLNIGVNWMRMEGVRGREIAIHVWRERKKA